MRTITAADARLLLMHGQGLLNDPERRATRRSVQQMIERLGFVQIDSINILERAHHLTLWSRLHGYRPHHLRGLHEKQRSVFEHWTHDASIIPIGYFAHWHHRRVRFISNPRVERWVYRRIGDNPVEVIDSLLARIDREGPMRSRDFEHEHGSTGAWWGWKPAKAALEYLWWRGDLSIARRIRFEKVYDLTARIYPDHHRLAPPEEEEFIDWACRSALERLGVATPTEIAEYFGALTTAEARRWCESARGSGEIEAVCIEPFVGDGARRTARAFALADLDRRLAAARSARARVDDDRLRLLCPFDPILRDRSRAERLFGFEYRFEAFVPAPKRKYGYYVLPILRGDQLIGRSDLRFDRRDGALMVNGVWWERGRGSARTLKRPFREAAERLAELIGANSVRGG